MPWWRVCRALQGAPSRKFESSKRGGRNSRYRVHWGFPPCNLALKLSTHIILLLHPPCLSPSTTLHHTVPYSRAPPPPSQPAVQSYSPSPTHSLSPSSSRPLSASALPCIAVTLLIRLKTLRRRRRRSNGAWWKQRRRPELVGLPVRVRCCSAQGRSQGAGSGAHSSSRGAASGWICQAPRPRGEACRRTRSACQGRRRRHVVGHGRRQDGQELQQLPPRRWPEQRQLHHRPTFNEGSRCPRWRIISGLSFRRKLSEWNQG